MLAIVVMIPLSVLLLLNTETVQSYVLKTSTELLSEKIGSDVTIGSAKYSLFTEFELHDIHVKDQQKDSLLSIDNLSVRFRILPLLKKHFVIKSIELEKPDIKIVTDSLGNNNFQFIIDAFANPDTTAKKKDIFLQIRKLSIRNAQIKVDNKDAFHKKGIFDSNHIKISNLNTIVQLNMIRHDSINFRVKDLSLTEKSGFVLNELDVKGFLGKKSIRLENLFIKMPESKILLRKAVISYANLDDLSDIKKISKSTSLSAVTESSYITGKDIACFVPALEHLQYPIKLKMNFTGSVNNIKLNKLVINYGNSLKMDASVELTDISKLEETFLYADIKNISCTKFDIEDLVSDITQKPFILPQAIQNMGTFTYKGNISGFFSNIVAYGKLTTRVGTLFTDLMLGFDLKTKDLKYSGKLRTPGFNLSKMLGEKSKFGNVEFGIEVNGEKHNKTQVKGTIKGTVNSIQYSNYTYHNIIMDGSYNNKGFDGKLELNDKNGKIKFDGDIDLSRKMPIMNFKAQMKNVCPNKLNLTDKYPELILSLNIKSSLEGTSVDNLLGDIAIDSVDIRNEQDSLLIKSFRVISAKTNEKQSLHIISDVMSANIEGKYTLSTIADNFKYILSKQLPTVHIFDNKRKETCNDFTFDARIMPLSNLAYLLNLTWSIDDTTKVSGFFNDYENSFEVKGHTANVEMGKNTLYKVDFLINNPNKAIVFTSDLAVKTPKDSILCSFNSATENSKTELELKWENTYEKEYSGTIKSNILYEENLDKELVLNCFLLPTQLTLNDSIWGVIPSNFQYEKGKINIHNFSIERKDEYLHIDGIASKNPEDIINADFKNLNLEYVSELIQLLDVKLSGMATGQATIGQALARPVINANIDAKNFGLNGAPFGHLITKAYYNQDLEQIELDGDITNDNDESSKVTGYVSPARKDLLLNADITNVNLSFLQPYLSSFASKVEGKGTGTIHIGGSFKAIQLWGDAYIKDGMLSINFLKTDFYFSDFIHVKKDAFIFPNITVYDKNGNSGKVNGKVSHNSFSDFKFDFDFNVNKMLVYNTTENDNPDFFGTVYATGVASIKGDADQINIDVVGKTEKNTVFSIPISSTSTATENNFIRFVNKNEAQKTPEERRKKRKQKDATSSKLAISIQIEATPDAQAILIMDEQMGEVIQGRGSGNIRINYEPNNDLKIYGNYTLQEGKYLFVMQNAIRKTFEITEGSTIAWDGDPYNGDINIGATYQVSASLIDLLDADQLQDIKRLTIPVTCKVQLTDELRHPSIKFDLELPTADEEIQRRVKNIINTDEMMNRQMIFLLLLGKFYNPDLSNSSQSSTAELATMFASATISSQLNYWLSQISNDVNLGINYRQSAEGELSSREIEVVLSTKLLDDRLLLNGNVGYKEDIYTTNNFIGDFDLEYKLNRAGKFRLKAYSHSNDKYYTTNALTTQGAGIIYTEDFDSGKNLLNYYKEVFRKKTPEEKLEIQKEKEKEKSEKIAEKKAKKLLQEDRKRRRNEAHKKEKLEKQQTKEKGISE